jgi:hypothetical protein
VISVIIWETWNHLKIFQKISEQHRLKAHNRAATGNNHIGQCARTSDSAKLKDTKCIMENNITCTTNCNHRTAVTLYILETWFVSSIANTPHKGDN